MNVRPVALLAVLLTLPLIACTQQNCRDRGYSPDSAAYSVCLEQLRMERQHNRHFAPHPRRRGD
jgi:hypothetical protein